MNIKKINLILWTLCISNIYNTTYKTTTPLLIRKITKPLPFTKPKAFNTYKTALPLSAPQINSLLLRQTPQIQNKIQNHPFFKELIIEVNNVPNINFTHKNQLNFDERTLLKLEIFVYCINHPQEAEEMMNFYSEIKEANHLIKERLKFLPSHAQEFFQQQLQKYLNSPLNYNQTYDKNNIKEKICHLYPYPDTALALSFWILIFIISFYSAEYISAYVEYYKKSQPLNLDNPQEQELLEIFNLLLDALNLPKTDLRKTSSSLGVADFMPRINCIRLSPSFFYFSLDTQIFILLHELRHYQQFTQITVPKDVIDYAKECQVEPFDFFNFFRFGFFTSRAMNEFDSDLFAARQMKDYPWINSIATEMRSVIFPEDFDILFDPETGYLSSRMISKEGLYGDKLTLFVYIEKFINYITKKWHKFINSLPSENMYLEYIPQHLKEAAKKNKLAKEEAQQIFEAYREF